MNAKLLTCLVVTALLFIGCAKQASKEMTPIPTPTTSACCKEDESERGPISDLSLYNLESTWLDSTGREIKLVDLRGEIVLVAMVYSSCKAACPRIIDDMRQIRQGFDALENVRFVLVSIDPEVDTPERLAAFAKESQLGDDWQLLHGDSEDVMELAVLLGVKYRKTGDTDYAHSNIITLLNREGEIVHEQEGLGVDPEQTIHALAKLLNE